MSGNRIAILGGSFDPVHLGHLFLLHCAVSMTDYTKFILIPAKLSNFKQGSSPLASDRCRLEMLSLALQDYREIYPQDRDADIVISDMEISRGGVSYTSDTVRFFRESDPSAQIGLVMGDDHVGGLSRWHDFGYLRDNVEFLICRRSGDDGIWKDLPENIRYKKLEPSELAPQSSSAVRADRDANLDYLSQRVREYVRANDLYS